MPISSCEQAYAKLKGMEKEILKNYRIITIFLRSLVPIE